MADPVDAQKYSKMSVGMSHREIHGEATRVVVLQNFPDSKRRIVVENTI
jgi:hypothetical protein